jgi:hypothetical protein
MLFLIYVYMWKVCKEIKRKEFNAPSPFIQFFFFLKKKTWPRSKKFMAKIGTRRHMKSIFTGLNTKSTISLNRNKREAFFS